MKTIFLLHTCVFVAAGGVLSLILDSVLPLDRYPVSPVSDGARRRAEDQVTEAWSGLIVRDPPANEHFVDASVKIQVPQIQIDSGKAPDARYAFSAWVGIDGSSGLPALLQAGLEFIAYTKPPNGPSYDIYAWVEWLPSLPVGLMETQADGKTRIFDIKPGDWIEIVLEPDFSSPQSTKATVSITNINTAMRVTRELHAPKTENAIVGRSVEWIMEQTAPTKLPAFGELHFKDCSAKTKGNGGNQGRTMDSNGADHILLKQRELLMTEIRLDGTNAFTIKYSPRKA